MYLSRTFDYESHIILSPFFASFKCINDQHRAQLINSSWDLPDNILTFVRRHPLMAREIQPIGGQPLLFKKNVNYTRIAVHKVTAVDGNAYNMIFLGTGDSSSLIRL